MLVYSENRKSFTEDVNSNRIEEKIYGRLKQRLGHKVGDKEIRSWKNSLLYMNNVLNQARIPGNASVSIEYRIPQTAKRIDFILTGQDSGKTDTAVIVELKQWEKVDPTRKDGIVSTYLGKGLRECEHPSYQAWTYAALLQDFNVTVQNDAIQLCPCAYLHNCRDRDVLQNSFYASHYEKAPVFLKDDADRLADFLQRYVKYGDSNRVMYRIENSEVRPSKNLADELASMLQGNQEFIMVDEQKLVYETVLDLAKRSRDTDDKHVLIVQGGPGTGKSVVAVNLLVELTKREYLAQYVTKNAAPRDVYHSKLTGTLKKTHIKNLFKSSGSYTEAMSDEMDVLLADEAHRLNEKSGMFQHLGENQIKEIMLAAKHSVFFLDEDQRVTFNDIGEKDTIRDWAQQLGAHIHEMELASQFRCNGSDGYLAWLDNALQIRETANEDLGDLNFDFQVFDDPNQLRDLIFEKNAETNKARMVAGYCWDWISKNDSSAPDDVTIPEHDFSMRWNLAKDENLWILKPDSVQEIGCIHTCQGLELDYVGVIIGPDIIYRDGQLVTCPENRANTDRSLRGYKKMLKEDPDRAKRQADLIIRNTYRTLLSRGQKGCYIFCTDPETNRYFKELAGQISQETQAVEPETSEVLPEDEAQDDRPFRILPSEDVRPYENAVPVYDLQAAAGQFSEADYVPEEDDSLEWAELPAAFRPRRGMFIAQVGGESMNRRIPNGAWCLFQAFPAGTRNGKVVLVQHRDIVDEDTQASYTIKRYESEKREFADGTWEHARVILKPDTTEPNYEPIVLEGEEAGELNVIAEFIAVL